MCSGTGLLPHKTMQQPFLIQLAIHFYQGVLQNACNNIIRCRRFIISQQAASQDHYYFCNSQSCYRKIVLIITISPPFLPFFLTKSRDVQLFLFILPHKCLIFLKWKEYNGNRSVIMHYWNTAILKRAYNTIQSS